jgi:hypothetical protein
MVERSGNLHIRAPGASLLEKWGTRPVWHADAMPSQWIVVDQKRLNGTHATIAASGLSRDIKWRRRVIYPDTQAYALELQLLVPPESLACERARQTGRQA